MKKLSFVLAAAGLMTLAACGEKTPVANTSENVEDVTANVEGGEAIENVSDNAAGALENGAGEANATEATGNAQ